MARALSHSIPKAAVLPSGSDSSQVPQVSLGRSPLGESAAAASSATQHSSSAGAFDSEDEDSKEVTTIYIGNLPPEVDECIICVPFGVFGRIHSVQVGSQASLSLMSPHVMSPQDEALLLVGPHGILVISLSGMPN